MNSLVSNKMFIPVLRYIFFQSLCEFSKMKAREIGLEAAILEPPAGIITRNMFLEEKAKEKKTT